MAYPSLAEYLEELYRADDLRRIEAPIDCRDELAVVADRAYRRRCPALLLGSSSGSDFPIAANLAGTGSRITRLCAGRTPDQLAAELADWLDTTGPGISDGWLRRLGVSSASGMSGDRYAPKTVKSAECQQVVRLGRDVDVTRLPMLGYPIGQLGNSAFDHPNTPASTRGGSIGSLNADESPELSSEHPDTQPIDTPETTWLPAAELYYRIPGSDLLQVTRATVFADPQRLGHDRLTFYISPYDPLVESIAQCRRSGKSVPIGLTLGGDPAGLLALAIPQYVQLDTVRMAGLLRGKGRELVRAREIELPVPADADFVVETLYDPDDQPTIPVLRPMMQHDLRDRLIPITVRVQAITHRANPVGLIMPIDSRLGYLLDNGTGDQPFGPQPGTQHGPASDPLVGQINQRPGINESVDIRRVMFRVAMPLLQRVVPDLADMHLPAYDQTRRTAMVSIRKYYAGQARRVADQLCGLPPLMSVRTVVVVDHDVDLRRHDDVWQSVSQHADWAVDVDTSIAMPDPFDIPSHPEATSHRITIDATRKNGPTDTERLQDNFQSNASAAEAKSAATIQKVVDRWSEFDLP